MKSKRDFISEFQKIEFPFKDTFKNDKIFRNELFNEFLKTDKRPSLRLYIGKFYTKKQIAEGVSEPHNQTPVINSGHRIIAANIVASTKFEIRLRKIISDFDTKIHKGELEKKYYCHDLEQTNTIQTLKEIGTTIDILKKAVFNKNTDLYKERETRAEIIILSVTKIRQDTRNQILEAIISDKENILIRQSDNEIKYRWTSIKSTFNLILSKHLNNIDEIENGNLPDGLFKILAIEKFKTYEISMIETGIYFDSLKRWTGTVDELAAFIWALKEKKYFTGNNFSQILPKERDFFQSRYKFHKQLKQKTKLSYRENLKTKMKEFIIPDLI